MKIYIAPEDWIMSIEAAAVMFGPFILLLLSTCTIGYYKGHCEIFYERNKSTQKYDIKERAMDEEEKYLEQFPVIYKEKCTSCHRKCFKFWSANIFFTALNVFNVITDYQYIYSVQMHN